MKPKKFSSPSRSSSGFSEKVGAALRKAVADVIEDHRRSGQPLAVWQDGRVVMLPPEQAVLQESPSRNKRKGK